MKVICYSHIKYSVLKVGGKREGDNFPLMTGKSNSGAFFPGKLQKNMF
jgi:hypothetical protein